MQLAQGPLERRLRLVTVVALTGGTLNNTRIKHLQADQARALAFGEMDLARAARGQELLAPAPTGAAWRLAAPTPVGEADEVHLWTPSTSVQGALPDPPADAPPGIPTDR